MRSRALTVVLIGAAALAGCGGAHAAPPQIEQHYRAEPPATASALAQAAKTVERRLRARHVAGTARVQRGEIVVRVPAAARSELATLTAPGRLRFLDWEANLRADRLSHAAAIRSAGAGMLVVRDEAPARTYAVLADAPALRGSDLTHVRAATELGQPAVTYDFTPAGRAAMQRLARTAKHFAVVLDDKVLALPEVGPSDGAPLTGGDIEGGFTKRSAADLAAVLQTGPLPVARLVEVAGP